MLISRVPEEGAGRGEAAGDIARGCRTASELFDLMTKDHDFEAGDDTLSTSDLVLLYKNIDLGTQLMSNVRTNQYVETVYHDEPETDSDLSECCSSEELRNLMLASKERINLLNNHPSFNTLSHKLGDLEIQVSNLSTDIYGDRHFLHKDPYIKEQLQGLQMLTKANDFDTNLLPISLLDYICCRRLEDNYNFYMDNVITYVTHTIEQLRRISNGDYLPDKVKEKWRESDKRIEDSSKVLSTSNSMPLQCKTRLSPSWDDIVRTEVDLRSLVKLLEKKVFIEVPRMIFGSYKFFSKFRADGLVISCERKKREAGARAEPRLDVVLRVQSAAAGHLASHADSTLPQLEHQISQKDCKGVLPLEYQNIEEATLSSRIEVLPLECQNIEEATLPSRIIEISDLDEKSGDSSLKSDEYSSLCFVSDEKDGEYLSCSSVGTRPGRPEAVAQLLSARVVRSEAAADHATPNDLHISMVELDRPACAPDENTLESFYAKAKKKSKSPERPRIRSPYENKSYIIEERKRKRLLEVRERRERRKRASNENRKVSKHKACPQAVSSVTKLSITNKAFYNSIYGRCGNVENVNRVSATSLNRGRKGSHKVDVDLVIQENGLESEGDAEDRGDALTDKIIKKVCSNFLDDTETEMSYLQSKQGSDFLRVSTSTSVVSIESATNLSPQPDYECPYARSFNVRGQESSTGFGKRRPEHEVETIKAQPVILKNPSNSPNGDCDKAPAVECRRSLEKIYTLMQKLHQIETTETSKKKGAINDLRGTGSESGTTLKRRVSFSNPRFEIHPEELRKDIDDDLHSAAVPKVVISAKLPAKSDDKKERKPRIPRVKTIPENPLIAISQLLHNFDDIQKSNSKIADPKSINRSMSTENTEQSKPTRLSRIESPARGRPKVTAKVKTRFGRDERPVVKPPVLEKKITELMDEVKEARGEAVRGPPRFSSRLNALAQPKRTYVQALAEEFPRRQTTERPARPASHTPRTRRGKSEGAASPASVRAPNSPLERAAKLRHPTGSPVPNRGRAPPNFASVAEAAASRLQTLMESSAAPAPRRASPARAPLLPDNVKLPSYDSSPAEDDAPQSSSIGIKLHHMVRAVLSERSGMSREPYSLETPTVSSKEGNKLKTRNDGKKSAKQFKDAGTASQINSVTEIEMLEHALHRSLSSGAFAGRLRVNKHTLSPRPSLQQVIMQQSGDTSLVLKSSSHQKIHVTCQSTDQRTDLMGLLSNTRLNCGFSGFPLQISTVGFAFPTFQCELKKITPQIVRKDRLRAADAGPSYEVTEPASAVWQIKDVKQEEACQCVMGVQGPTETSTNAQNNNAETAPNQETTVLVSPSITSNRDEGITPRADQENDLLSDYTASFDILVGLLNEIQKITTCGCDATSAETVSEPRNISPRENVQKPASDNTNERSDDLEIFAPETKSVSAEAMECKDKDVHANCVSLYMANSNERSDDHEIFAPETKSVSAEAMECKDKDVHANCVSLYMSNSNERSDNLEIFAPETKSVSAEAMECKDKDVHANRVSLYMANSEERSDDLEIFAPETKSVSAEAMECKDKDVHANRVSLYMSNSEERSDDLEIFAPETKSVSAEAMECKPVCADKEVSARVAQQQATAGTSRRAILLNNVLTTTCSLSALAENCEKGSNTSIEPDDKMKELAVIAANRASVKSLVPYYNKMIKFKVETKKETVFENPVPSATLRNDTVHKRQRVSKECEEVVIQNSKREVKEFCLNADLDSTLKVKRDILVTIYSILVLTVFAALAFPEILQFA